MIKKKTILSRYEIAIVRAFAGAIQSVHQQYKLDMCDFLLKAFDTEIFNNFENEHCIYTQGYHCIAGKLLEEIEKQGKTVSELEDIDMTDADAPTAYWLGYLFMYWKLSRKPDSNVFKKYDLKEIYWDYDVLHTTDIDYAIDSIIDKGNQMTGDLGLKIPKTENQGSIIKSQNKTNEVNDYEEI